MSHKMTESELEFIILRVIDNALSAAEESKDKKDDYSNGRKLAYYEILDTIKNELDIRDVDTKSFGLDIVLEKLL